MSADDAGPTGKASLRAIAMPADTNPSGDIFGGWLLSQMDLAGGTAAQYRARGRVATVGIEAMTFHKPVRIGEEVSCYTDIRRVGRTSITVHIETWTRPRQGGPRTKVTEGTFTYVALDDDGRSRQVPAEA